MSKLKFNMGCGVNQLPYYMNVDKFLPMTVNNVDFVQHDLEQFPWPWDDNCADEMIFNHSLEHMGQDPIVFCKIIQEIHRVCCADALIHIRVPHPRHDHFLGDPTHVRVVTPLVLSLFSKKNCEQWKKEGAANSPLAFYYDVDFEMQSVEMVPDAAVLRNYKEFNSDKLRELLPILEQRQNNVISEIRMILKVIK